MKKMVIKWILIVIAGSTLAAASHGNMKYGSNQTMVIISLLGAMIDEMYAPLTEAFNLPVNFISVMILAFISDIAVILVAFALVKGSSVTFGYALIFALICALIGRIMDLLIRPKAVENNHS